MASKSQIRLQQLTGSIADIQSAIPAALTTAGTAAASVVTSDMEDVMEYYAKALANIHGNVDFGAQVPGTIKHQANTVLQTTGSGGSGYRSSMVALEDYAGTAEDSVKMLLRQGSSSDNGTVLQLVNSVGSGDASSPGQAALLLSASAGGALIVANAASKVELDDGLLTLDLNGTDVVDGLLVDAEGSVTLQAAHASDGAIVLNAEDALGVVQMQNQGAVKLAVSASFVEAYDQFRVKDSTASTSASTGALIVDGGAGFGDTVHMGGDIESDDAMALLVSSGELRLSGSSGVEFAADGNFTFTGHSAGGVLLMDAASEATQYRSNFSATTSIMAAINALYATGQPSLYREIATSTTTAGSELTLTFVDGDDATFTTALKPNQAEVYVNGQLMLSGSGAERSAGTADYNVTGDNKLTFSFDIVTDDVVALLNRA